MIKLKSTEQIKEDRVTYLGITPRAIKTTMAIVFTILTFASGCVLGTVYGKDVLVAVTQPGTYEKLQVQTARAEGLQVGKGSEPQQNN